MPNYRRAYVPAGMYFFTLVTDRRVPILTDPLARRHLRRTFIECKRRWPFHIEAIVLLPDHLHTIWSLPPGDDLFSLRWAWIKKEFTKSWVAEGGAEQAVSDSRRGIGGEESGKGASGNITFMTRTTWSGTSTTFITIP